MSPWSQNVDDSALSAGLLVRRLVVGLGLAAHGARKLFGWFGGHGLSGTGAYLESIGFRPGRRYAALAGLGEFVSALLVDLGFLGPIGPGFMLAVMLVAMMQHWKNGFFDTDDGVELPLLYATAAVALGFTGYGAYSLDAALGLRELSTVTVDAIALAVGIGGLAALGIRRPTLAAR